MNRKRRAPTEADAQRVLAQAWAVIREVRAELAAGGPTKPTARKALDPLGLLAHGKEVCLVVPAGLIGEEARWAAWKTAEAAARELGIPTPDVRWYAPQGSIEARQAALKAGRWPPVEIAGEIGKDGFFDPQLPRIINLRAGLDAEAAAWVAAHETRHAWQHRLGEGGATVTCAAYASDPDLWEDDATEFALNFTAGRF
jgi:hypothetical protein